MPALSWESWLLIAGIAGAMILSMLHALASAVRVEMHVHDTRVKAASLRRAYAEQLAALEEERDRYEQVEIVGQGARQAA